MGEIECVILNSCEERDFHLSPVIIEMPALGGYHGLSKAVKREDLIS
jgi:hypothetical protein